MATESTDRDLMRAAITCPADAAHVCDRTRALGESLGTDPQVLHRACRALEEITSRPNGERPLEVMVTRDPLAVRIRGLTEDQAVVAVARVRKLAHAVVHGGELRLSLAGHSDSPPVSSVGPTAPRQAHDLRRFASVVGHDLKMPLNTIQMYVASLRQQVGPGPAAESVREIEASCERLLAMLDGLLDYARQDVAPEPMAPADPLPALREAIQNLDEPLRACLAVLEVDDLPPVPVPHVHLVEIFQNLLSNACKYRRGPAPRIHVHGGRNRERVHLRVSDDGLGIPEAHRHRVFELFQRLERDRDRDGIGVGLARVARLVERYGGTISIVGRRPHGTQFLLSLPLPPDGLGSPVTKP